MAELIAFVPAVDSDPLDLGTTPRITRSMTENPYI
jgi:hypothetical protein